MAGVAEARISVEREGLRQLRELKDLHARQQLSPARLDRSLEHVRKQFGWAPAVGESPEARVNALIARVEKNTLESAREPPKVNLGGESASAGAAITSRFDASTWGSVPARTRFEGMVAGKEPTIDAGELRAMQWSALHVLGETFKNTYGTDSELRAHVKARLEEFQGGRPSDAFHDALFAGSDKRQRQHAALGFVLQSFRGEDGRDRSLRKAVFGKLKELGTVEDLPAVLRWARRGGPGSRPAVDALSRILDRRSTATSAQGRVLVLSAKAEQIISGRNAEMSPRDLKSLQGIALNTLATLFDNQYGDDGPLLEQVRQKLGDFPASTRTKSLEDAFLAGRSVSEQQIAALKFTLRTFRHPQDAALREAIIDKLGRFGEHRLPENAPPLELHADDMHRAPEMIAQYLGRLLKVEPWKLQVYGMGGGFSGDYLFDVWTNGKSVGVLKVFHAADGSSTLARFSSTLTENGVRTPENLGTTPARLNGQAGSTLLMERVIGTTLARESISVNAGDAHGFERLLGMAREDGRFISDMQTKLASGELVSPERKRAFMDYVLAKLQTLQHRNDLSYLLPEAQLRSIWTRLERSVFPAYQRAPIPATMSHGDAWSANFVSDSYGPAVLDLDRLGDSMDARGRGVDGPGRDVAYYAATLRSGFGLSDTLHRGERAQLERAFLDAYRDAIPFPPAALDADYLVSRVLAELNVASWGTNGKDWASGALARLCELVGVATPAQVEALVGERANNAKLKRVGMPFALGEGVAQTVSGPGEAEAFAIANPLRNKAFLVRGSFAQALRDKTRFAGLGGRAPYQAFGLPVEDEKPDGLGGARQRFERGYFIRTPAGEVQAHLGEPPERE